MRFLKTKLAVAVLTALFALGAASAPAFIREGGIPGRSGLSFHNIEYYWKYLELNITNGTKQNVIFGGTMIFMDRHGKIIARAELLPEKIKRSSTRHYRASFTQGSGEEASSAWGLRWDLNQRNK